MRNDVWRRYAPSASQPWNDRRVIHLYRRAAFGATWAQIQRDVRDGPDAAVDRLLDGHSNDDDPRDDFESLSQRLGQEAVSSRRADRLKSWWIFRMLFTPDPLTERLTLMWHNHFATSNQKVRNLSFMKQQNDLFRRFAMSPFSDLFSSVVKSPAMLIWLDAQANHKDHPNENLAREIMELFALGVNNYSETDVKEAARALTGWIVDEGHFRFDESLHDAGEKTIFGNTGRWNGDDLLKMLTDHSATASRIAFRICELFMGENVVDGDALGELATGIQSHGLDLRCGIETVLRSELFFHDSNIGNRPLAPIEFIVGAIRGLELFDPAPSTMLLSEWSAAMGQNLFEPPSVFGWAGGRDWLTTRTLIARTNFANAVAAGTLHVEPQPIDCGHLTSKYGVSETDVSDNLGKLLAGGSNLGVAHTQAAEILSGAWIEQVLSSPDAQLA